MVQLNVDNDIVNHLLFHKSLIDEENDTARINKYIKMAQMSSDGENLAIDNPFDRSIAIAFDLVLKQQFNPWNIDLVNFSTLYLKRAKDEKIDLITAGRIIYMAWKVLRLQSDGLIVSMEAQQENEYEPSDFDWGDLPSGAWLQNDDGYSYTNLVMKMPKPPIEEPIRRNTKRKVSLIELLDAFDIVRKESEEYQILDKARRKERERLAEKARKHMKGTAHEDHIEEDVLVVWQKISKFPKKLFALSDLYTTNDPEDRIKTLLSVLFLAYDNKIKVFQKRFPYGKIFIKNVGFT